MDKTATVLIPLPPKGENNWDGYDGKETTARAALNIIDAAIAALNGTPQGAFIVAAPTGAQTIATHALNVPGGVVGPVTGALTGNVTGAVTGNLTGNVTGNLTGNVTGNSTGTHTGPVVGDVKETLQTAVITSVAITAKQGIVPLGSAGALAVTLADPTSGADDGKRLSIYCSTAHAHVITIAGGIAGGTNNTITFGGAIGDNVELEAIAGKWFLRGSVNATLSHV
jgi:hypothetical protein